MNNKIYQINFIISLKNNWNGENDIDLTNFLLLYNKIIEEDKSKPIFINNLKNYNSKYDRNKKYNKNIIQINKNWKIETLKKGKNAWKNNNNDTINKDIRSILNKISDKNSVKLTTQLINKLQKVKYVEVIEVLAKEILEKVWFDKSYHNIYVILCKKIWSLTAWHDSLVTIVKKNKNKYYWYSNHKKENHNKELHGPFYNEKYTRQDARSIINFKNYFINLCQVEFNKRHKYIDDIKKLNELDSTSVDIDLEEIKIKRKIFGTIEIIGYLFKKKYISEKIIHVCFLNLLHLINTQKINVEKITTLEINCLSILWNIIKSRVNYPFSEKYVDEYFNHFEFILKNKQMNLRTKFMLQDLINSKNNKISYKNTLENNKQEIAKPNIEISNKVVKEKYLYKMEKLFETYVLEKDENDIIENIDKKYSNDLLFLIIYRCFEYNKDKDILTNLINILYSKQLININNINHTLINIIIEIDELIIDIPYIYSYLADIIEKLLKIIGKKSLQINNNNIDRNKIFKLKDIMQKNNINKNIIMRFIY